MKQQSTPPISSGLDDQPDVSTLHYNGGFSIEFAMRVALRHLAGRTRQTVVATLGIVVGGTVFALMIALTDGQMQLLRQKLIETSPHIVLEPVPLKPLVEQNLLAGDTAAQPPVIQMPIRTASSQRRELKPYTGLIDKITAGNPHVESVSPFVRVPGVLRNGTRYHTVKLHGVEPARERRIGALESMMQWGGFDDLARIVDGVLIGRELADRLGLKPGDEATLVLPSGQVQTLRVAGIFNTGVDAIDDERGYVNLSLAHVLKRTSRIAASGISVQVDDLRRVEEVRDRIEASTGYRARTWEEINSQVLEFQRSQSMTARLLVLLIFTIAAFGIFNSLAAVVLQKKEDIAVMKAFGVSRRGVVLAFLFQGVLIGIVGGALAALLGYGLTWIVGDLASIPAVGSALATRPASLSRELSVYLFTFGVSVVIASLASMLPARRAATYVPVRILRGEG